MKCEVCKSDDGCIPANLSTHITGNLFTKEDWAEIYKFEKYVRLPFYHRIVAKRRKLAERKKKWK